MSWNKWNRLRIREPGASMQLSRSSVVQRGPKEGNWGYEKKHWFEIS